MRLAAAKEAADPDSVLLGLAQPFQVGFKNALHTARIFAITDKVLQLETERFDLAFVVTNFGHLGDAVVEQLKRSGVTEVEATVRHGLMKLSCEVMGTAM